MGKIYILISINFKNLDKLRKKLSNIKKYTKYNKFKKMSFGKYM